MNQRDVERYNYLLELVDESMKYKTQIFSESGDFWEERHCLNLSNTAPRGAGEQQQVLTGHLHTRSR